MYRFLQIFFVFLAVFPATVRAQSTDLDGLKIAFLADVHLQDLYGSLMDTDYKGTLNPKNGRYTFLRMMDAQLHSTRIFNENYFAFLAALDDIAKRGVKYVALPGDYSDDGQAIHIRGLQGILQQYSKKYNIQFFITTGNHDPVGPFKKDAGKVDFLGEGGKRQPIFSSKELYHPKAFDVSPVIISQDFAEMGYVGITDCLQQFGFFPKKEYLYWETPFSDYSKDDYSYAGAVKGAELNSRMYEVTPGHAVPDVSYLVEPVEGLWLLAIDGNVYIPKEEKGFNDPKNYSGASLGYNNVLSNKKHLISWVNRIASEAKKTGKVLIAFSHFPMIDFNDGASFEIGALMGKDKWQLERVPNEIVASTFADAGLQIHFAGHMHINDTGIRTTKKGNTLINIQTPSLAAYVPGYKLLTIKSDKKLEVETIEINDVPQFNELFDLYKMEYDFLKRENKTKIWDKSILETKSYREFTTWHLKELVRLRFLPSDWPKELQNFLLNITSEELLILTNIPVKASFDTILKHKNDDFQPEWEQTKIKVEQDMKSKQLSLHDFKDCTGFDLIFDFYKLHSADALAITDIGEKRLKQYRYIIESFLKNDSIEKNQHAIQQQLNLFFIIFNKFLKGTPADHFLIDLKSATITDLH